MISINLSKLASRSVRRIGAGTLISMFLLLIVQGSVASGLKTITNIQPDTSLLLIATLGMFVGWGFARTHLSGWRASSGIAAIGIMAILIHTAHLGAKVFAIFMELTEKGIYVLKWLPGQPLPDTSLIGFLIADIASTSANLIERLFAWLGSMLAGASTYDTVAATLLWGSVIWITSAWAGWAVRRRGTPLLAVLPGGALLASGMAFSRGDALFMLPLLSGTLMLMAWVSFTRRVEHWDRASIDYAEDIDFDLILWVCVIVFSIITISTMASFISPQKTLDFLREIGQPRNEGVADLGESLGLQQNPESEGGLDSGLPTGELPREHLLGSGPELSRQVVMVIETDQSVVESPQTSGDHPRSPYRWRALTYDLYTGRGWATSATYDSSYPADAALSPSVSPYYKPMEMRVQTFEGTGSHIYVAGELASVDQDYQVSWRVNVTYDEPDTEDTQPPDMFGARFERGIQTSSYTASSFINLVGISQLRAAGEGYPPWISERYLQLPDRLPQRVQELAVELTAAAETPYDRAQALEDYLRQIPYNLDVPPPPEDSDVADYFLFELREGYCDYYATAMATMGRAVGIPTRLAIGYATGRYDETQDRFIVTAKEAHSWVEVYFPGIGWVEFEPTGGLPAITRPDSLPVGEIPDPVPEPVSTTASFWTTWLPWLVWVGAGIATLLAVYTAWMLTDTWRLRRMPTNDSSTRLYQWLYYQGRRLEVDRHPGDTPHEFTLNLIDRIRKVSTHWRWQEQVEPAQEESRLLIDVYNQSIYSPSPPDRGEILRAIHAWVKLRQRLWLARLLNSLPIKRGSE